LVSGLADGKKVEEMASALLFMSFSGALEARHMALDQAEILIRGQKGKFKPFHTMAANGAITNLLAADRNMVSLYSAIMGKNGTNINISNNNLVQNNEYLTPEEAVKILNQKDHHGLLRKPDLKIQIGEANQIQGQPEVIATKQTGFKPESIPNLTKLPSVSHIERNELDGDIMDGDL